MPQTGARTKESDAETFCVVLYNRRSHCARLYLSMADKLIDEALADSKQAPGKVTPPAGRLRQLTQFSCCTVRIRVSGAHVLAASLTHTSDRKCASTPAHLPHSPLKGVRGLAARLPHHPRQPLQSAAVVPARPARFLQAGAEAVGAT